MSTVRFAFRRFWQSETGPRTVHFWAPTLKWGLVVAGLSDARRPVEKVSGAQNLSLLATAAIWTRWSFVITPKNNLLAAVNAFLAMTAGFHLLRIADFRIRSGDTMGEMCKYIVNGTADKTITKTN
ncbi:similar to Saccharomyces cerevisiae YHR162W Putative protein of unknown function [Maudiozyma barnettii]|uniref:Mitochondrial pyruvate carrier n=1 Tax=Maudiozyma barnettii TaxID=61262 RepID=A0A8H2VG64_9SACH|nr:mitochondrial pyruvate carrier [Kazachstania barnettii]CAB4254880.1 similar to Saccharomyces cerevisiae YHR162W Putative protein of unknown function [Kazachstania barnettii]CAD1783121.1 similar to Saccharomyces cerevisiae YHR162W Putative protein of unknown function [Kazachstania barnettii]